MKHIILFLHSVSSFFFCLFLSFHLQFPGRRWRMSACWGSQGRFWKEFVCVCNCEWNTSDWIDNQGIKSRSFYDPQTCTRKLTESVTGSIHCSQETFWWCFRSRRFGSCCCLCRCFWVRSVSQKTTEQPPQNIHDWSSPTAIVIRHLIHLAEKNKKSKHFALKTLKYGERCQGVNWHLFGLFVCLVSLPNSHQATRQQGSDFSYTSEVEQRYNAACQNDTQVSCNDYIVFAASLYPSSKQQASAAT